MGGPTLHPVVLDAGALIGFDRGDRPTAMLVQRAREHGAAILIPAGVLAQVWRDGARQARLAALLGGSNVRIDELNGARARAVGELCGRRRTSDVVDASVVLSAREHHAFVATSNPDDLLDLDPGLDVVPI